MSYILHESEGARGPRHPTNVNSATGTGTGHAHDAGFAPGGYEITRADDF